jgi:muramoyltetrapeptide carboxypeptidase
VTRLRGAGYRVRAATNATSEYGYLAGPDSVRAAALNEAIADPEARAVLAVRGGYGILRILDRIDFTPLRQRPKVLLGYSDFTALLLAAHACTGIVGFHGPMPAVEMAGPDADFALAWLDRALAPEPLGPLPLEPATAVVRPGTGSGPLLGGCLSLLAHLAGTPYLPSLDGAVLFWEEVGEPPYRIDRMLTQLRLAGHLSKLSAMIVGGLTDCGPHRPGASLTIEQILRDVLDGTDYPVVLGLPVGHIPRPITVPLGVRARVEASAATAALVVEEAATVLPRPHTV